jgi:hypothetical protein
LGSSSVLQYGREPSAIKNGVSCLPKVISSHFSHLKQHDDFTGKNESPDAIDGLQHGSRQTAEMLRHFVPHHSTAHCGQSITALKRSTSETDQPEQADGSHLALGLLAGWLCCVPAQ